ncbi:MAG: hypothetical protein JXB32_00545 [Deltaproteobacteria bacterium]|nr:hypothetical protein [Deltaproteobacteria bacterium]
MKPWKLVLVIGLIVAWTACKKKDEAQAGAGSGGGGGGSAVAASAGLELEAHSMEFGYSQFHDSRRMVFKIEAQIPKGWKMMTEGESAKMMNTFMPAPKEGETPNLFTGSSVTISATCNGQCLKDQLVEQLSAMGKQRLEMQGEGAKLLQDGELQPGVLAFVVEKTTGESKLYNVGVTHIIPGQDSAVLCEALLQGEQAALWEGIRDACVGLRITAVDPLVGEERAKQELANLANCPASSSVKYTPKEPNPAEDPVFESVQAVRAEASQPGSVSIYLSGVPMADRDEFRNKELQPGQGVLNLGLYFNGEGEILSGKYPMAGDGPTASAGVRIAGGTTLTVSGGAESYVEVIARTPDRICGRINLVDNWRTITGEFVADILPTR